MTHKTMIQINKSLFACWFGVWTELTRARLANCVSFSISKFMLIAVINSMGIKLD